MNTNADFNLDADPELSVLLPQTPMIASNYGRANPVQQQLVRQDQQQQQTQQPQQPVEFRPNKIEIKWGPGCGSQCKGNIKKPTDDPPPPPVYGGKRKKRSMKRRRKNSKKYKTKNHKRRQTKRVIKKRNKLNNS
uniref:Uncharacterized protein n=1 Tax=viral metagenome TaxID=1070528 RepID=A0A6C0F0M6_9ZZZZ